jgi:hypothetical protein
MKNRDNSWTTIAIPKVMRDEMNTYKRPYEPNYAFIERLMKKVRR